MKELEVSSDSCIKGRHLFKFSFCYLNILIFKLTLKKSECIIHIESGTNIMT